MTEDTTTGVDVLRKTVHARNSPHALTLIAGEVPGVGVGTLEAFAAGKADLGVEASKALTRVLHPHAEFDPESGMLRPANRAEPKPLCSGYPPQRDPKSSPGHRPMPPGPHLPGPQPVTPQKPQAKTKRAGWLSGFL
jgi:hypothetical protein